jgi:hypothetical protein
MDDCVSQLLKTYKAVVAKYFMHCPSILLEELTKSDQNSEYRDSEPGIEPGILSDTK